MEAGVIVNQGRKFQFELADLPEHQCEESKAWVEKQASLGLIPKPCHQFQFDFEKLQMAVLCFHCKEVLAKVELKELANE